MRGKEVEDDCQLTKPSSLARCSGMCQPVRGWGGVDEVAALLAEGVSSTTHCLHSCKDLSLQYPSILVSSSHADASSAIGTCVVAASKRLVGDSEGVGLKGKSRARPRSERVRDISRPGG